MLFWTRATTLLAATLAVRLYDPEDTGIDGEVHTDQVGEGVADPADPEAPADPAEPDWDNVIVDISFGLEPTPAPTPEPTFLDPEGKPYDREADPVSKEEMRQMVEDLLDLPAAEVWPNTTGTWTGDTDIEEPGGPGQLVADDSTCGQTGSEGLSGQIVGGKAAKQCEWKWQAGLVEEGSVLPFCGASLISPEWVLTAAHCVYAIVHENLEYSVLLGAFEPGEDQGTEQLIKPRDHFMHPDYDAINQSHDFALIWLSAPATLNSCVGTICLEDIDAVPNEECKVTGWGTLSSGGRQANILQETSVFIRKQQRCWWPWSGYGSKRFDETMLCANGRMPNWFFFWRRADACQGDSGGPLVCKSPISGRWYLQGLVSWGDGCGSWWKPGVYGKISMARSWIDSKIELEESLTTTAPITRCPDFASYSRPDADGDCSCNQQWCSTNGVDKNCPSSAGVGAYGGLYFSLTCVECMCHPF